MDNVSKWKEIKCDYLCEDPDDMFWRVDAWVTDDGNEEGKVIAYVDDLTGRVVYADPDAKFDPFALAVIADKVDEIKDKISGNRLSKLTAKMQRILYEMQTEQALQALRTEDYRLFMER